MTSAPQWAITPPAEGTNAHIVRSTTLIPARTSTSQPPVCAAASEWTSRVACCQMPPMGIERFRFDGKRCVVTGAASGMGKETAKLLVELGGEVYGLDVAPAIEVDGLAAAMQVDLKDPASIEDALEGVGGEIHALCSVAGLPGAPFSDLDTITVNFIGARHLIETAVARSMLPAGAAVGCITSFAGNGWEMQWATVKPLIETPGFDDAKQWCEANSFGGYGPSKIAM